MKSKSLEILYAGMRKTWREIQCVVIDEEINTKKEGYVSFGMKNEEHT